MSLVQKIAALYLFAMVFIGWGIAIGKYHVFPFQILKEVDDFIEGHALGGDTTLADKIMNDMGIEPGRFMRKYPPNGKEGARFIDVAGLNSRRESPLVFVSPGHREGYRVIFGAFDFENSFWGGVLLGPAGETLHTWQLSTEHLPTNKEDDELKNLYGLHLLTDGSVIFNMHDEGGGIVKVDGCGKIQWNLEGDYHHTITPTENGDFWTFTGKDSDFDQNMAKISQETGEIVTIIDMAEVRKLNPHVHIFNLQADEKVKDISHGNDIQPLFSDHSMKFKDFESGDLLISYRTHNLVFVLDPDTLKVKWWRIGPWDRQHDADWEADGKITVFSNNEVSNRKFSDIISIDPNNFEHRVIVDGEKFNFYSKINGDHEISAFGTRMITSATQGWAFEVDRANEVVFSFVNNYDSKGNRSLHLSEASRLPENYFDDKFWRKCSK